MLRIHRLLFVVFFPLGIFSFSECFQLHRLKKVIHANHFLAVSEEQEAKSSDNAFSVKEGYSRYLVSKRRKNKVLRLRDRILKEIKRQRDREDSTLEAVFDDKLPFLKLRFPTKDPGQLILIRSGESEWNVESRFTGWAGDPDLTDQGKREMEHAARLLIEAGYEIDIVFTSRLKRAIRSVWTITNELGQQYLPVFKSWRLNGRMYGALTGLSKAEAASVLGTKQVQKWRHSLTEIPPPIDRDSKYFPKKLRKYADLEDNDFPLAESLLDSFERTRPIWEDKIAYELHVGRTVLVVAHSNTIRGLIKHIDNVNVTHIQGVKVPPGVPIVYNFDRKLRPVPLGLDKITHRQPLIQGVFLEKPGLLQEALKREEEWRKNVPDYEATMTRTKTPMTAVESSLTKLVAQRELENWALSQMRKDPNWDVFSDVEFTEDDEEIDGDWENPVDKFNSVKIDEEFRALVDTTSEYKDVRLSDIVVQPKPTNCLVMIRHGKTEHNKLGLFTGWEDAQLAQEGREEAREAGRLLKEHCFEFDVVYTSWLSRAIETAWLIMDELDSLWLPMVKSWRLNERMYGRLTGKSKRMISQKYGENQLKLWRRGYSVRPPPVSSFCVEYPGNDVRYRNLHDVRYSFTESLLRSIDSKRVMLNRKLPKTESLKDCMNRVIPYYHVIKSEAIDKGKSVLIASSENAIRGLLKYLCDIPEEKIAQLEIPNGLPLVYDFQSKTVKLLDDHSGINPLIKYNFGDAGPYLFPQCISEEECNVTF